GTAETTARSAEIASVFRRYRVALFDALRDAIARSRASLPAEGAAGAPLDELYAQIEYHFGWREADLRPARHQMNRMGKLLRPTLVLLSCELAAAQRGASAAERETAARQAIPAAVAVELVHNFSLVHDDIEDGDEERHARPTLWKLWGVPQAIN